MGLLFDEATHTYTRDGVVLPSVSEIIKAGGLVDFSGIPQATLDFARDRGKAVHLACELHDLGLEDEEIDPRLVPYMLGWGLFCYEHKPEWESIEIPEDHPKLAYAGTPDRRARIAGKRVLIDIKAVFSLAPEVQVQLSGYDLMTEKPSDELWSVRLTQKGGYIHTIHKQAHSTFLSCLNIYNWRKRNPK